MMFCALHMRISFRNVILLLYDVPTGSIKTSRKSIVLDLLDVPTALDVKN